MDARSGQAELILARLDTLPALPVIASRLLEMSGDERIDLKEISSMIEADPALSARVLAMCRRAELGLGERITTVRRAVVMLGLDAVRSAVLSVCVFDLMNKEAKRVSTDTGTLGSFDISGYWKHAIGVACACERIAREHSTLRIRPDEAFVAGLLHDFGRLALTVALPKAMARAQELAAARGMDSAEVERELMGLDHSLAGKRLAEHWGLPESISQVIWLHVHEPEALPEDDNRGLIMVVRLGRALCRELYVGASGDFGEPPDWRREANDFKLIPTRIEKAGKRLHADVSERCKALGVCDQQPPTMMLESIARANQSLGRLVARLDRRQARDERASEALIAIARFHASLREQGDLESTTKAIVEHAGIWFGSESWLVIAREDGASRAIAFERGIDLWLDADDNIVEGVLSPLREGKRLADLSLKTSDTICKLLGREGRLMRAMRLCGGGTWLVLVGEGLPRDLDGVDETIAAVWASAASSAQRFERVRAMSEGLAAANSRVASLQAARSREESMRRLGETTAGAAHEMNNPLTRISGQAQRLAMRLEGENQELCEDVVEAAHELSELVTSLHMLAEDPQVRLTAHEVRGILGRAVEIGRATSGIDGDIDVSCAVLSFETDGELLARALGELIANALQSHESPRVEIHAETSGLDGRLKVIVRDHGRGLSPKARRHAFDPFFSERDAGRGRGLGLSRARRLVDALGGKTGLLAIEQGGTEAWVELPAQASAKKLRESA